MKIALNILDFKCNIHIVNGKKTILDRVRNRYVHFTQEEWVRQYIISHLFEAYSYPLNLMQVEKRSPNKLLNYRPDIVILKKCKTPLMIIECKAPNVNLSSNTLAQISRYNTDLGAKILMITNGLEMMCWQKKNDCEYSPLLSLPSYSDKKIL